MATATLKLKFLKDGTVEKSTMGFTGKSCETITAFIEKALGATDIKRTHTEEYDKETRFEAEQEGLTA